MGVLYGIYIIIFRDASVGGLKLQAVILAGGLGTRIMEESHLRPKPLIEIGDRPIIWHIMKIYSAFGVNNFIICCGYKGHMLKEYFTNYHLYTSDMTIDIANNSFAIHQTSAEPWKISLVDTGLDTMTGGRIKRISHLLEDQFFLTYGDGLADINITQLLEHHNNSGKLVTVSAFQPVGRFGSMNLENDTVTGFAEKPNSGGQWINAGFFVCQKRVVDYIASDKTIWEREPLERLVIDNQLNAYKHTGFWSAMDTLREKKQLERLWNIGEAPWQIWQD
jgi:glucose-1-phosphate cytidylyltransferase